MKGILLMVPKSWQNFKVFIYTGKRSRSKIGMNRKVSSQGMYM